MIIMSMSRTTYTSSSFRVGLKLGRKSEGLAYENAENRYPQRTIRPKIDPLAYVRPTQKAERKPWCGLWSVVMLYFKILLFKFKFYSAAKFYFLRYQSMLLYNNNNNNVR